MLGIKESSDRLQHFTKGLNKKLKRICKQNRPANTEEALSLCMIVNSDSEEEPSETVQQLTKKVNDLLQQRGAAASVGMIQYDCPPPDTPEEPTPRVMSMPLE